MIEAHASVPAHWHLPCVVVPLLCMTTSRPLTGADEPKWHPWSLIAGEVQKCCRCNASYFCPITPSALGSFPCPSETPSAVLCFFLCPYSDLNSHGGVFSQPSQPFQFVGSDDNTGIDHFHHFTTSPLHHHPARRDRGLGPQPHRLSVTPYVTRSTTGFSRELLALRALRDSINTFLVLVESISFPGPGLHEGVPAIPAISISLVLTPISH